MISTFLSHSWTKLSRSVSFGKEMATTAFIIFFSLILITYCLLLGFGMNGIIVKVLKINDSIGFLNGMLIYYFGFEFMMRYFLQNLPVLDVQPYLHLPIKRSTIVHYLLGRSALSVLNILVFLLFTPFAFTVIAPAHGLVNAWSWLLGLWFMSLALNYATLLFKKKLDDTVWGLLVLVAVAMVFAASDYFGLFKMSTVSSLVFQKLFLIPIIALVPAGLTLASYLSAYRFYKNSFYPEEITSRKETSVVLKQDISFLQNLGATGDWINVEAKLILRNKRPRTMLFLSAFFLFYGLIFYTNPKYSQEMPGMFLFTGIFITGIFMINYGQFLFGWQASHFDFTLTQPVSMKQYVQSKYYLLSGVTVICFVLSIPYVYFGWQILFIHASMMLFNLGVNVFIIMNIAMWEPKKMDLSKGATFNYQGVGAAQWVMGIPILASPFVFYLPFSLSGHPHMGVIAVAVVGAIGLALNKKLLEITTKRFTERKYQMAASFRKE